MNATAVAAVAVILTVVSAPAPVRAASSTLAAARTVEGFPTAGLDLGPEVVVQADGGDLTVLGYSVPSLVDWDNDTLPDLVVGEGDSSYPGKVRVYLNGGTPGEPAFAGFSYAQSSGGDLTVPASGCLGAFPRVVQWDGDGRKDLLVGLWDGTVMLFLNVASDDNPSFDAGAFVQLGPPGGKVDLDVGLRATPTVVDWNNDGRKDLVVGAYDGYVRFFLNEGSDTAPDFRVEGFAQSEGSPLVVTSLRTSPAVLDLTGDGRKDLLLGETNGTLLLFENTSSDAYPSFAAAVQVTSQGVPVDLPTTRSRPALGDWNGDGTADVLVGSSDGRVRLYRGLGALFADGFELGTTSGWSAAVP